MANSAGEFCHHWKSWTKDYLKIKGKHCEILYQWIPAGATDKGEESALTTVCGCRCGRCVLRAGSKRIASRGRFVILVALQGEGWNAHVKVGAVRPLDAKCSPVHKRSKSRHLILIPLSLHSIAITAHPVNCQFCQSQCIRPELLWSNGKNKTKRQESQNSKPTHMIPIQTQAGVKQWLCHLTDDRMAQVQFLTPTLWVCDTSDEL